MRKIIIAIFSLNVGIALQTTVYARVDAISGSSIIGSSIIDSWEYSSSITTPCITNEVGVQTNDDYNGFQYVNIIAATDIFKNGAKFCGMQLQHNFQKWKIFIAPGSCKTICKTGYYGQDCTKSNVSCDTDNLKKVFKTDNLTFDGNYGNDTKIEGFLESVSHTVVLQVTDISEHGVKVAPIRYNGNDNADMKEIRSICYGGKEQLLCAQGYKLEDGECVISETCNNEFVNMDWCGGWGEEGFSSDEHELIKITTQEQNCKEFRCKGNKGFAEDTKSCISCPTTRKQGVIADTGICEKCTGSNEMFNGEMCVGYTPYNQQALRRGVRNLFNCWMESWGEYKECVKCQGTWDKTRKQCTDGQ